MYPQHTLTEAWKRFIFHQFHDDLTGTSIPRAYEFSWNDELISLKQFSQVLTSSVNAIAGQMDTRVKGTPVVLYNANAFPVSDLTEIILEQPKTPKGFTVYNAQGKKVASQMIGYENGRAHILVAASLPANSYAVYDVRTGGSEKTISPSAASAIENSVYKITLDKNGDIISLTDKRNNKELVKDGKAIRLALFTENKSYAWPAWEILKETIDREPVSITDGAKITLVENGALRKALCIEKKYGKSLFKQYIRLYEGSRADRIDFYNEIDWQSTNTLLKAEFPLNIENEKATYDLGIGSVERGNNVQTAYEVYAQQWADLTDKNNSYGVSILNDSKYGWDKPDNNTIRLTLLHTPETKGNYAYQDHQDFGFHTFTYSLTGHNGALDKPATAIKAEILNQPIKAFSSPKHAGTLGKEFAFVRSSNDQVVIKALKKAEVSDEYVVRVYETGGAAPQQAAITFAGEIEKAVLADGTEKEIGSADFNKNQLNVSIAPYSIQTFKVKPLDPDPGALEHFRRAGENGESADRGDRRKRLAAESQSGDPVDVLCGEDLAGPVRLDAEQRVVGIHSGAVVGDADQPRTGPFDLDADVGGSGVDGVFHQFLDHRCGAFDHLPGRDPVAELFIHHFDLAHGAGSSWDFSGARHSARGTAMRSGGATVSVCFRLRLARAKQMRASGRLPRA